MKYPNTLQAIFLERPNRFVARCLLEGHEVVAHVPNTGRCKELLVPGRLVFLVYYPQPERRTRYTLVAVDKDGLLINIDSQAPNRVVGEALEAGTLQVTTRYPTLVRREAIFGSSRLDFMVEAGEERALVEVKGVTLEENGEVRFPDAPTLRGLRHLEEISMAVVKGCSAYLIFVVQMEQAECFVPNDAAQPQFGEALRQAERLGVRLIARLCHLTSQEITLGEEIPIYL